MAGMAETKTLRKLRRPKRLVRVEEPADGLTKLTTRVPEDMPLRLARAALERRERTGQRVTLTEIVTEALEAWLKKHGS